MLVYVNGTLYGYNGSGNPDKMTEEEIAKDSIVLATGGRLVKVEDDKGAVIYDEKENPKHI